VQRAESLEAITDTLQTLICNLVTPCKVKIDGVQGAESLEAITETLQTLICDLATPVNIRDLVLSKYCEFFI